MTDLPEGVAVSDQRLRFSRRTAWDRGETEHAAAVRTARDAGRVMLDLTSANPTVCGLELHGPETLGPLAHPAGLTYDPNPRGMFRAREAVSRYYDGHGCDVSCDAIVLTASTSEAYSHLFRLLCNADDEVLVPQPSYPLFDYLAELADVRLRPYPLFPDHGWWIDFGELERQISSRTRAILVVHPNNPTGHATSPQERRRLTSLAARHGLALIVDEVFLDYPIGSGGRIESFAAEAASADGLTFVLSGLSKTAALPQMKLGWIAVCGAPAMREEAMARLEIVSDAFLSVSTPAQIALPLWLAQAAGIQAKVLARLRENLATLRRHGLTVLDLDGGWSCIVRIPRTFPQADAATALRDLGILAHPAEFYGLADAGCVVVSLLTPAAVMDEAAGRVATAFRVEL